MTNEPKWAVLAVTLNEEHLRWRDRLSLTNLYGMEESEKRTISFANTLNQARLRNHDINTFYVAMPRYEALGFIALQKEEKEASAKAENVLEVVVNNEAE